MSSHRPVLVAPDAPVAPMAAASRTEQVVTGLIVVTPLLVLAFGVVWFWGEGVHLRDIVLAAVLFFVIGHGITVGYHRLLAHKAFVACRPLKLALVGAGSMAFQGGPIGWVADHRRHHVFSDQPGDPHSPHASAAGSGAGSRDCGTPTSGGCSPMSDAVVAYAADLLADRDIVVMNAFFPLWCIARSPSRSASAGSSAGVSRRR